MTPKSPTPIPTGTRRRSAGFTLVELLVAVTIGMVLTLAVTLMLTRFESGRRALTSTNDASQSGAYVAYTLDRLLRSAGSGYLQGFAVSAGCRLHVARSGTQVLPRSADFPAPFASVPRNLRLAPVLVFAGAGTNGSDLLAVMAGAGGVAEQPLPVISNSATATSVNVPSTTGLRGANITTGYPGDLVLISDGGDGCMLQQVSTPQTGGTTQTLTFGGTYAAQTIAGLALANFYSASSPAEAWVSHLGSPAANRPVFNLIGVDTNATLVAHDVLQLEGSDTPVAIADGVADLRARYGIDNNDDDIIDEWVDPGASPWRGSDLQAGTAAARDNMKRIQAVRVAVVVRAANPEREAVSPATLTMFRDLDSSLQATRTLSSDERRLRWRVLEFTVPLRNMLFVP